ncbi:MAG: polyphosphate:AMP phosphotransferase [Myxococcales bacterium]|nr:polyphosphate:AMP phosphotransferase [Myxococcales bacterium]
MFRTAELGRSLSKDEFDERAEDLRLKLLIAQDQLQRSKAFQVIVDLAGVGGAGKGMAVNALHTWLDTRFLTTRSYTEPSEEERQRPAYWRYWRDLPPKGRIGLFLRGRYRQLIIDFFDGKMTEAKLENELDRITAFEDELSADGALILKFWLHLGQDAQATRLKKLESDPATSWRVTDIDWKHWHEYDRYISIVERVITKTNTGVAPWHIVESADGRYRDITIAETIVEALADALRERHIEPFEADDHARPPKKDPLPKQPAGPPTILSTLDQSERVDKNEYQQRLLELQAEHHVLQRTARHRGISSIYVFEGSDAAGKGGSIRRLVATLDARNYQVIQVAAPTEEEAAQHYLWRFWRHVSAAGRLTVFDRSWYGRVLVERVEGFASQDEWRRAYAEMNDFEEQLTEYGIVLAKFYLHITPDEQWKRFEARLKTPYKRWKLTKDDWRNRARWWDYEQAVHDMFEATDTRHAPWTLIAANDKRAARLKVLRTACEALRRRLNGGDAP